MFQRELILEIREYDMKREASVQENHLTRSVQPFLYIEHCTGGHTGVQTDRQTDTDHSIHVVQWVLLKRAYKYLSTYTNRSRGRDGNILTDAVCSAGHLNALFATNAASSD